MSPAESAFFEPRFGVDFSSVRIHATASAAEQIGAQAFTKGSSITFAREPDLGSAADQRLFAHELAHVVQQRREPALAGTVMRKDVGITRVAIHLGTGKILVTLTDGRTFTMELVRAPSTIKAGTFRGVHTHNSTLADKVLGPDGTAMEQSQKWYFASTPPTAPTWKSLDDSTYELTVRGEFEPEDPLAGKADVKGKDGEKGQGKKEGPGTGDKPGEAGGTKGTGEKGAGEKGAGEKTSNIPVETEAEKKVKVNAVLKRLKDLPDTGATSMTPAQVTALAEMSAAELDDVVKFLKNAAVESETPIDASAEMDKYLKLSPSDRELLRVNQELMGDAKAGPLPDQVRIALENSAESNVQVAAEVKALNDGLQNLAAIKNKVTHPELKAALDSANLDPIDLEKLPVFREMMMLEGLLAGASTKSPEIEASAKDLTKSIAGIRDYVLEEIAWLAAELGASYLIGMLLGPAGTAVAVGRGVMLINRLNKLRLFLQKVESAYAIYQQINTIATRVTNAWTTYKTFETEFASGLAELEKLTELADDPNLAEEGLEAAVDKVTELEDQLVEKMLTQLESGTGLGALLENFDIPQDATEDDLRQILFNIPKGVRELDALMGRYRASGRDLEAVKLLTYKSVLVGALLYPFVGFLTREIGGRLSALMQEPDLSTRLINVIAGAAGRAGGKKKYAPPGAKRTKDRLAGAKRKPKPATPKKSKEAKKSDQADESGTTSKKKRKDNKDDDDQATKKKDGDEKDDADPASKKKRKDDDDQAKKNKDGDNKDEADQAEKKKSGDEKADDDPTKKKADDDPTKKKADDDTNKKPDPTSLEWMDVERKVGQLPARNPDGITKKALLAAGKAIAKRHPKVAGRTKVTAVPGRGDWRMEIHRKPAGVPATVTLLMGYRDRWEAGQAAIEAWVPTLPGDSRGLGGVRTAVQKFKDPYHYTSLDTEYFADEGRRGGHRGVQITGRMGKMGKRDIAVVDDPIGLHTGQKNDPIPLWWYKDRGWYRGNSGGLRLPTPGVTVPFPATASARHQVTLSTGAVVPIGIDDQHIIGVGSLVQRTKSIRQPNPPKQMRAALDQVGVTKLQDNDIDHVQDLGFGGTNEFNNLWPLDREKNRYAFLGRWYRDYTVMYLASDRRTVKRGALWNLVGKWFTVQGTATKVANWGGRDGERP